MASGEITFDIFPYSFEVNYTYINNFSMIKAKKIVVKLLVGLLFLMTRCPNAHANQEEDKEEINNTEEERENKSNFIAYQETKHK